MKNFRFNIQTAVYFGRNCVEENSAFFKAYGDRAVIFTTKFPDNVPNKALNDVEAAFAKESIDYLVIDEVAVDPPVETCVELAKKARTFNADFFVGIGGGSSIDTSKAVAVLMDHPDGEDPYKIFYTPVSPEKNIKTQSKIPVIGVPTTAGTGAELSPYAVLTRADTSTKLAMFPFVYCLAAFCDPRYIEGSPDFVIHTGMLDALAHGVESYLHINNNTLNRMFAEYGFSLFKQFKDNLLAGELTPEDYDMITLHSSVMGMAFSSTNASTTLPHGLGYPLSHIKRVNHGLSCAVFLGEYLRGFKDQSLVQPIVEGCGFNNSGEFAEYCNALVTKHVHITVSEDELEQWTDAFMATGRVSSNPEPFTRDDVYNIYRRALKRYLK
ncbi:MAG: iron-containing alcohol dehydrogenase [Oscillospiraceae bacterium]